MIELRVPSLRERAADIALIADACIRRLAEEYNTAAPRLHEDALQALLAYAFPGNVRELENVLERAFTLCDGNVIRAPDLRLPGANAAASSPAAPAAEHEACPSCRTCRWRNTSKASSGARSCARWNWSAGTAPPPPSAWA